MRDRQLLVSLRRYEKILFTTSNPKFKRTHFLRIAQPLGSSEERVGTGDDSRTAGQAMPKRLRAVGLVVRRKQTPKLVND
jgi:hypothetical protein